jgi:DNA uptake protein ComE-like DNA-binding protein
MTSSHMKQLVRFGAVSALVLGGCAVDPAATETPTETSTAAVTIDDTDLAPECAGIVAYVNTASLQELDSILPVDVANAIVLRRTTQSFVDLADLSSVSGIAQARLAQIAARARTLSFIGASCAGVYEELAVSADDSAAILAYANTAAEAELWDVVRSEPNTVAPLLVSLRPFATLQALVDVSGVGPSTFRSLRDAAVEDPFDELAGRVNAANTEASIKTAFNWYSVATDQPGQQAGMLCFGVPADLVTSYGGQLRANLATASEVMSQVTSTVNFANRYNGVGSSTAGLAHLSAQVAGGTFLGCYLEFQPNPWCGYSRAFFVNTDTGHRVLTETYWCE